MSVFTLTRVLFAAILSKNCADVGDHVVCPVTVPHNSLEGRLHFVQIGLGSLKPPQSGICAHNHGGQWLFDLMRDRSCRGYHGRFRYSDSRFPDRLLAIVDDVNDLHAQASVSASPWEGLRSLR